MEILLPIVFGTVLLVVVVMILVGGAAHIRLFSAIASRIRGEEPRGDAYGRTRRTGATDGYSCRACGAPVEDGSRISPSGDYRCTHCGKWSNVHRPA